MALPFLPGNSFKTNIGQTNFTKPHHFEFYGDINRLVDKDRPNHSALPRGNGPALPTWVAFDKQVLCFDGYFQESVTEKNGPGYSVHQCKIYFYLEDDSVQVIEPKTKQSGTPQGTIIRRHRVQRPDSKLFYTLEDFNLGNELSMYGRVFKLCSCDEFTRNFLTKIGIRINTQVPMPGDPYTERRATVDDMQKSRRPYDKLDTMKQFMDHDRHVLRFYCYWDDSENAYGDPREMVLHYYLADDTIEVREIIPQNSGRDAVPMFLHRCKLPKKLEPLRRPGEIADRTVLNVFGPMGKGGRYILDNLKTGEVNQEFYRDTDLAIGAFVNVWGRKFLICDCDEFTKEYYRTKYGIEDFTPIVMNKGKTQQDSGENGELPLPPKRSFARFMSKDSQAALRFLAKLNTAKTAEQDRRFIISFFLADDSIVVFEPPVRNSGVLGGKFLERSKIQKPSVANRPAECYTATDFFIGAMVDFNKHKFTLIDADEYAYTFMEQHSEEFPQSNIELIMDKLIDLTRDVRLDSVMASFDGCSYIPTDQFCDLVRQISQGQLTDQEVITLARYYQDRKEERICIEALLSLIQEQMKRVGFEDFRSIEERCMHFDGTREGLLDAARVRTVFRSLRIPVEDDMLRSFIAGLADKSTGKVDYHEMVGTLNWRINPVTPVKTEAIASDDGWQGNLPSDVVQKVNVQALLQDLSGIKRC